MVALAVRLVLVCAIEAGLGMEATAAAFSLAGVPLLAGQCATDAPALLAFYERNFKKQGSFPVFEMIV